ncbi:isoamyl acetate-hydrolyzing esterase 1 homolog isoform X2 [Xenia sp. Carnegie-2017]|uniref:isoamyl acetate-hydrolyzing esterase 1 homolog isoform X2 n=1 Tax=Xenia sp. Carnegie-2017 TaxID=2897299 RepID=UPI001F033B70|nr:isoamyl acetate-hydrolyzing esterase 1 homolog isoform X2 [Xenia sp. Carnegie-2017]
MKFDVINRGFSGYTTRSARLILSKLLQNDNHPLGSIKAVTILLGTNDCEMPSIPNSRHVPISEYKENLTDICEQFRKAGVSYERQLLITPPPMNEDAWSEYCKAKGIPAGYRNENIRQYAVACSTVGKNLCIEVIDLWGHDFAIAKDWNDMLSDGLHFSAKGNNFLSQMLIPRLNYKLCNSYLVFPDWENVHPKEPSRTLGITLDKFS